VYVYVRPVLPASGKTGKGRSDLRTNQTIDRRGVTNCKNISKSPEMIATDDTVCAVKAIAITRFLAVMPKRRNI